MRHQHHLVVLWRTRTFVDDTRYNSGGLANNYIVTNPYWNRTQARFLSQKWALKKMKTTMLRVVKKSDPSRVFPLKMVWKRWCLTWLPYAGAVIGWTVNGGRVFYYLKLELKMFNFCVFLKYIIQNLIIIVM